MPSGKLVCRLPDLLPSPGHGAPNLLGRGLRQASRSPWQRPARPGRLGFRAAPLPLPRGRNREATPWAVLFHPTLRCLGAEGTLAKSPHCPYLLHKLFLVPQRWFGDFPSGNLDFCRGALIHGDRPRLRSAGTPGPPPEGPEPGHGLLQLPQPVPKSTCPLPDAPGRVRGMRPLLGPPHKVLGPRLPQRYFCAWTDAEFLLLHGARDKGWLTLPSTQGLFYIWNDTISSRPHWWFTCQCRSLEIQSH